MRTDFMDMHSGGGSKENRSNIYIELPQEQAEIVFYNRFGHNPHRVSCTCCGNDYSISENESLSQLTGYNRNCDYKGGKYIEVAREYYNEVTPLSEYILSDDVLLIYAEDIKEEEKLGSLPEQGYVRMD